MLKISFLLMLFVGLYLFLLLLCVFLSISVFCPSKNGVFSANVQVAPAVPFCLLWFVENVLIFVLFLANVADFAL